MNLKKIIKEEMDDFSWTKGEIEYPIDFIIGKKVYFRKSNLSELESKGYNVQELNKSDLKLGEIRFHKSWEISKSDNSFYIEVEISGDIKNKKQGRITWPVEDALNLVRLGVWVIEGDDGKLLNESEDFNWIKDIEPEITDENFHMFYNKPFYWYDNGKPVPDWGMPRVFWFEDSGIHQRGGDKIALLCYKDVNDRTTSEPKDECTDIFHKTAISFIKKGTLQYQPRLGDIKNG